MKDTKRNIIKNSSSSSADVDEDIVVGCQLVAVVHKLRPKKMALVTFYVATAFAVCYIQCTYAAAKTIQVHFFTHIYQATFSIRTYVAVSLNKRLRQHATADANLRP
jgi:hypothetical protein